MEHRVIHHDSTCRDNVSSHQQIVFRGQEFCIEPNKFMDAEFPPDPALSLTQEFLDSIMPRSVD